MATRSVNDSSHEQHTLTRTDVPQEQRVTHWGKALWIGHVAGGIFIILQMLLRDVAGRGDFWDPLRLSASVVLGSRAVATSGSLASDVLFIGVVIHFLISIWYALVLGMIIRTLKMGVALAVGALFGVVLYVAHYYGLAFLYPWVVDARGWIAILAHLVFGVTAAWIYTHLNLRQLRQKAAMASSEAKQA